ncbi:DUF6525 family protein [Neogemmobacter tilapiae]|uniref:Uncharacterized protein n=1 Tax=Neogemmobacter tilapiae TaxID=875041 RepID=A0A918TUL0_9RHOB|nr:DUF6525 family protein [Gemmobacter tilapiae]GHC64218.1 hypothetical protein GCM10007315_30720 [Gemmobacter tilapiae]
MKNLRSSKARWRRVDPMAEFDRLPPALRRWLHEAALPWSAGSAQRIWDRALGETGCEATALARLARAEAETLRRA